MCAQRQERCERSDHTAEHDRNRVGLQQTEAGKQYPFRRLIDKKTERLDDNDENTAASGGVIQYSQNGAI